MLYDFLYIHGNVGIINEMENTCKHVSIDVMCGFPTVGMFGLTFVVIKFDPAFIVQSLQSATLCRRSTRRAFWNTVPFFDRMNSVWLKLPITWSSGCVALCPWPRWCVWLRDSACCQSGMQVLNATVQFKRFQVEFFEEPKVWCQEM